MPAMKASWDIFCRVIDNFGDAGVCWRLARQLVDEHACRVRLWIDAPEALCGLQPAYAPQCPGQAVIDGVDIRPWPADFPAVTPAGVVIEAFACDLPQTYLAAMASQPRPPVWFNLDYLSAESWVDGCHGLASPHPQLPLSKQFFFPGFSARTGGLLREARLPPPVASDGAADRALRVNLFCYADAPVETLLRAHHASPTGIELGVFPGQPTQAVTAACASLAGQPPACHILPLAFLPQSGLDSCLAAADINFVRGEDSFVRAQLAGRPFVWHIYRQADDAHLDKLHAFLDCYCADASPALATVIRAMFLAWNTGQGLEPAWRDYLSALPDLRPHALAWAKKLFQAPDLAGNLVKAAKERL